LKNVKKKGVSSNNVKSDKSLIVECNKGLHEEKNDKNTMESTLKIHKQQIRTQWLEGKTSSLGTMMKRKRNY
jgi:hypothetical protein